MKVKPTLMILAAGMGSRYGGLKQIEPVGPSGETIMDYSVYDALRAGFGKLLFVIRKDIEAPFRATIGSKFEGRVPVEYAFQELADVPAGFPLSTSRQKPWGTGHAILAGRKQAREPFAVINADDFYGQGAFAALARHFESGTLHAAMVGYVLENTLSEFGSVARGVCRKDEAGFLAGVREMTQIERAGEKLQCVDPAGQPAALTGQEIVSLNTWGFWPEVFASLEQEFRSFLESHGQNSKAEFYIPTAVNNLISAGKLQVQVLHTNDSWFGVTYKEDRARVKEAVRKLVAQGVYPEKLWH